MCQTQRNTKSTLLWMILLSLFCVIDLYADNLQLTAKDGIVQNIKKVEVADSFFDLGNYNEAISKYNDLLKTNYIDSTYLFKKIAFSYAKSENPEESVVYIEKYIKATLDVSFVSHSNFELLKGAKVFKNLQKNINEI